MSRSFTVCIPAGGIGSRMNAEVAKQFLELAGKPIMAHSLSVFDTLSACRRIVIAAVDIKAVNEMLDQYPMETETIVVEGGETRQESVRNALAACDNENEIVMIHDAVRPCVTQEQIMRVLDAVSLHGAAMLALAARDTIKRVHNGFVEETLDREEIWMAQTPQGAPQNILVRAIQEAQDAGFTATDDASVIEQTGLKVAVVEGSIENIKITTREDIAIAEAILRQRDQSVV
jgi:2-C-methyl-D-erythritol 4-phosphate cytidylyltransferase